MEKTSVSRSDKGIVKSFKSAGEEQVTDVQASDWKREQNRLDLSLQEYLEWLSMDWAENF